MSLLSTGDLTWLEEKELAEEPNLWMTINAMNIPSDGDFHFTIKALRSCCSNPYQDWEFLQVSFYIIDINGDPPKKIKT
jgi:hypothetical protein